ncbi:C-X-C motif chemokine 11-1-like [Protopterus annectens]|uniref:C-X-C motif chemokine 11-1-like n=1 Tax=Protopterus annectens TaxID=7888 RepID=UPI001CFA8452|nr:C-X-C motif chemokine 11-1-like [Protopterus annectens]
MTRTTTAVFLALVFAAGIVQGLLTEMTGRCLCKQSGLSFVQRKLIEKMEVYPISQSCDHIEVIVTMKNSGKKICLNHQSKWVQKIINAIDKQRFS